MQYVLHFPPGALTGNETVSMTPVSAVHGSPLGNLVGAVAITPDGMELVKPATLTIMSSQHVSSQQDAGFAADFGGKDFSLYPISAPGKAPALAADDTGGTSMSVSTLSTYGVSNATNAQVNTALANPPASTVAQFQQLLVKAIIAGDTATVDSLFAAYFTQVLTPQINAALNDYTQVDAAVIALLDWARSVQTFGFSTAPLTEPYFKQLNALLTKLMKYEAEKVYEHCKANRDLTTSVSCCWARAKQRYWASTLAR